MLSLRDQLLAKGLVSDKRAKQIERELKAERKADQGSRERQSRLQLEAAAKAAADAEAETLARLEARRAAEAVRDAREHAHRVRQIVQANRIGARGPIPFHHRAADSARVGCLWLSEAVARDLRAGRLAIAGVQHDGGHWEYAVIASRAVEKLSAVAPEALVFHVTETTHFGDPSESLLRRDWEPSLRPHRVSP